MVPLYGRIFSLLPREGRGIQLPLPLLEEETSSLYYEVYSLYHTETGVLIQTTCTCICIIYVANINFIFFCFSKAFLILLT